MRTEMRFLVGHGLMIPAFVQTEPLVQPEVTLFPRDEMAATTRVEQESPVPGPACKNCVMKRCRVGFVRKPRYAETWVILPLLLSEWSISVDRDGSV